MNWLQTFQDNWFTLLQTVSIVTGLVFTGVTFLIDTRSRRVGHLVDFTKHHREIWKELRDKPNLARILNADVDLHGEPVTSEEERFVHALILHLNATHQAVQAGLFKAPEGLHKDVDEFFVLPIPRSVWERFKIYQDRAFVAFVETNVGS